MKKFKKLKSFKALNKRRTAMDKKKEAEKLRKAALEHQQKMETDPAYRKKAEEAKAKFEKHLPGFGNDTDD